MKQTAPAEGKMPRRQKVWNLIIVIGFLLVIYYSAAIIIGNPLESPPQLIAHRGGPVDHPENTLAAFRQAIEDGVNWLEFDVQMTKDGELVVFHDETIERTTNGEGALKDFTLVELQDLDAGEGEVVPTFEEVIELAKNAGVDILPEVKSPHLYLGIEQAMVDVVIAADYVEHTIFQSFDAESLDKFHQINPDIQLCMLYGLGGFSLGDEQPGNAIFVCPMAEMVLLFPWMIQQAHNQGYQVFVWFGKIENPFIMRLMLAFGADGLMVDNHLELAEVLDR
ncbi:MAG: hypothetical protein FVQ83_14520 [Chloroflexi bacterium]|nr:hypothetical protein [Chloroflexota bacterium]